MTDYRTLDDVKERLAALGFRQLKMTRQWKRRTHREALIEGFLTVDPKARKADLEATVLGLLDPVKAELNLRYRQPEYVHLPYSHCRGDRSVHLQLMADVALPAW